MPIRLVLVRLAADPREPTDELIVPGFVFARGRSPPATIMGESDEVVKVDTRLLILLKDYAALRRISHPLYWAKLN